MTSPNGNGLWVPGAGQVVGDSGWLAAVIGQLEVIVGLIPDVDVHHKRDTAHDRFFFQWGQPPVSLALAAPERLILEHELTNLSGAGRAGRDLVITAVERIIEAKARPDQVSSEEAVGLNGEVEGTMMDIRWAQPEGTVQLLVLVA